MRPPVTRRDLDVRSLRSSGQQLQRTGSKADAFAVNIRARTGGKPLPDDVRRKMEGVFKADFSDVRIHIGREAQSVGAIAFAMGSAIHFAPGQYAPHSVQGQKLLGHELAHIVQQRAGRVKNPFGSGTAVVTDHALEAEADRMGLRAALSPTPAASVQRQVNTAGSTVQRYAVGPARAMPGGVRTIAATPSGSRNAVGSVHLNLREAGVAEITNLHVAPEHRMHGVGRSLIDAAVRTARQSGCSITRLEARPSAGAAIKALQLVSMYQRMGFHVVGTSRNGNPLMERKV